MMTPYGSAARSSQAWREVARIGVALACAVAFAELGAASDVASVQHYPDVLAVKVTPRAADRFDFDVTMSSRYDTPRRYADAFRVMDAEGQVYGERILLHDHAGEQPFTRALYGVPIPPQVRAVIVQGRDQRYGYGGKTVNVVLPGR